jgi:OOP family OmpA-OmpF porin
MKRLAVLLIGVFLSFNCHAANPYIGAGIGQAKAKDAGDCSDLSGLLNPGYSCSIDDTDTSFNLFLGYAFSPNLSAELGYVDLGKYTIDASGTVFGTATPVTVNGDIKAKGWTLSAVGTLPIQPSFSLLGRFGFFIWDVDISANASSGALSGSASDSASGTDPFFGIGAQWNVNKQLGVRGEWAHYMDVGDENTTGQSDVDNLSISILFNF